MEHDLSSGDKCPYGSQAGPDICDPQYDPLRACWTKVLLVSNQWRSWVYRWYISINKDWSITKTLEVMLLGAFQLRGMCSSALMMRALLDVY
jgi:hypothetical protein